MLRAVADTNTVVSGLLYRGSERALLEAARDGRIGLCTSAVLLAELADVLPRAKFAARIAAADMSVPASYGATHALRPVSLGQLQPG